MQPTQIALLFVMTFVQVFLLGTQSKNVQHSRYLAAVLTSFGISIANFVFVHFAATGSMIAFWSSAAGGCLGIATAIWVSDNLRKHTSSFWMAVSIWAAGKAYERGDCRG